VREVEKQMPPLAALVSNAGVIKSQFAAFTSPADWRRVLDTNLSGAFHTTRAVARLLLRHKNGRIVYVSSCAALTGEPLLAAYAASKSGLFGLAKSVARELAASGSTVNVIAPGPVETDMTSGTDDAARQRLCGRIPLGRYAQPEEIARATRFLLSSEASYITGQIFSVDGGLAL
jgi:3-oxoacyl-[acyl-carrier protein] reductase